MSDAIIEWFAPTTQESIYLIAADFGRWLIKIGRSAHIKKRFNQFRHAIPTDVRLLHTIDTSEAATVEQMLHHKYRTRRVRGEWFCLSEHDLPGLLERDRLEPSDTVFFDEPLVPFKPVQRLATVIRSALTIDQRRRVKAKVTNKPTASRGVPRYCRHATGHGYCRWRCEDGQRRFQYFPGLYGSDESVAAYRDVITKWLEDGRNPVESNTENCQ